MSKRDFYLVNLIDKEVIMDAGDYKLPQEAFKAEVQYLTKHLTDSSPKLEYGENLRIALYGAKHEIFLTGKDFTDNVPDYGIYMLCMENGNIKSTMNAVVIGTPKYAAYVFKKWYDLDKSPELLESNIKTLNIVRGRRRNPNFFHDVYLFNGLEYPKLCTIAPDYISSNKVKRIKAELKEAEKIFEKFLVKHPEEFGLSKAPELIDIINLEEQDCSITVEATNNNEPDMNDIEEEME